MGNGLVISVDESTRRMVEEMGEGVREALEDALRPVENDVSEVLSSQAGVMRLSRDIAQASHHLSDEMERIAGLVQGFLQSEEGLAQLSAVRSGQLSLLENFGRFWQSMESSLGFLSGLSDSVAALHAQQEEATARLSGALAQSAEQIVGCVRAAGESSAREIREVHESVGTLSAAQEDGRRCLLEAISAIPATVSSSSGEVVQAVRQAREETGGCIREVGGRLSAAQENAWEDTRSMIGGFQEDARRMKQEMESLLRAASEERGAQHEELVHLLELLRGEVTTLSEPFLIRWLKRREG